MYILQELLSLLLVWLNKRPVLRNALAASLTCALLWHGLGLIRWLALAPSAAIVRGTLYQQERVYTPAIGEQVTISFSEQAGRTLTGKTYPARLDANGRFRIKGPNGNGIPLGAYRVAIFSMPENPVGTVKEVGPFIKYGVQESPLEVQVSRFRKYFDLRMP